jgi:hypothetical protein
MYNAFGADVGPGAGAGGGAGGSFRDFFIGSVFTRFGGGEGCRGKGAGGRLWNEHNV